MKNYIKYFGILCLSFMMTSCLVDDSAPSDNNDEGPNLVGFTSSTVNASVVADGSTSQVMLPVTFSGPTAASFPSEFTATIAVDPSSTAIEGVHYTLSSTSVTMSPDSNFIATFPITIITDGIDPPLDPAPVLKLNIVDISNSSIVPNGRTSSISVRIEYLCYSDITGKYEALEGEYWRIGVLNATTSSWPAETEIIYICNNTYRVVEYFGIFEGNEFYFEVSESGTITYPATTPDGDPQTGNGQPFITCQSNPGDMSNVPCGAGATNYVEQNGDEVILHMSYGYLTPGSGPREFYQVLKKL
ncbi:hypothetical protein M0G43_15260 [Subsaxibacter sp. CAU 1640]|uniref:hypothetical protein n=1 Tax=Subsaxibacter sp. CAU 1640 TaxID=2933271 RepID=UPI0020066C0B|nr:hypothetical protein [Subsaxibacter sp. CAU 1640]MCK7591945.1 hypothetical protein [Subsaxibacter sp. CAU 1640]